MERLTILDFGVFLAVVAIVVLAVLLYPETNRRYELEVWCPPASIAHAFTSTAAALEADVCVLLPGDVEPRGWVSLSVAMLATEERSHVDGKHATELEAGR